jgi:LacI family transcriptional regulator
LTLENARLRLQGIRDALEEAGLALAPNRLKQSRFDRLSAHEVTQELLRLRTRPTAIVCANDLIALGALAAVREAGLHCPEDISITGFDDLEWAAYTAPTLTTVAQPGYELGAAAASLLMQRLDGESGPALAVLLPSELRIRQSTAPPHAPAPSNSTASVRRLRSRA